MFFGILLLTISAVGSLFLTKIYKRNRDLYSWLPHELKDATLAFNEHTIYTNQPYRIVGRADRIYQLPNGSYVPLEYKTRPNNNKYPEDIAELSLQAWQLRRENKQTEGYGFVVVKNMLTGKRTSFRVDLKGDAYCQTLIERHLAVKGSTVPAKKSIGPKCKACGHTARCKA